MSDDQNNKVLSKNYYVSIIFMVIILSFFFLTWQLTRMHYINSVKSNYNEFSSDVRNNIEHQATTYEDVLNSGTHLFQASNDVNRNQFKLFYQDTITDKNKSINAINFVAFVQRTTNIKEFEQKVRSEQTDFPNYQFTVYPQSDKSEYWVINYIVPFTVNRNFFGFDILSDSHISSFFQRAADSGQTILTDKVTLLNTVNALAIQPVYKTASPLRNSNERRQALSGFVVLVLNPNKMFLESTDEYSEEYNLNVYVYLNKLKKEVLVDNQPLFQHVAFDMYTLLRSKDKQIDSLQYASFGETDLTIRTVTSLNKQLGTQEANIYNVIFILSSAIILVFFLVMTDLSYSMHESKTPKQPDPKQ